MSRLLVLTILVALLIGSTQSVSSSNTWTQTNWNKGAGQQTWSNPNRFYSSANINFSTSGELVLSNFNDNPPTSSWWSNNYQYRQKLTFNNSTQSENLADFPVLVKLTTTNFDFTRTQSDGDDIRFIDSNDSTELPYEVESWDADTKEAYIWVKVPQINGSSNEDFIYLYFGDPDGTNGESPTNVWGEDFAMVQHLNETNGQHLDSTQYNNDSTTVSVTTQGSAAGKIAGADAFVNTNSDYIEIDDADSLDISEQITLEAWVKSSPTGNYRMVVTKGNQAYELRMYATTGRLNLILQGTSRTSSDGNLSESQNVWRYIVGTYDGSHSRLFVDGELDEEYETTGMINTDGNALQLGARLGSLNFLGTLDEVRISSQARSTDWIAAQYASMNDTLINFGETERIPWQEFTWSYRQKVTFNNSDRTETLTDFPVLITLDSSNFVFSLVNENGTDIRFVDSDNLTSLAYQVEKWDNSAEEALIWVKVPQINGSSDTDFIYIYFGNSNAGNGEDLSDVWGDDYEGVWHFNELSGSHNDSTRNGYDSTSINVVEQGSAEGHINGTSSYNGTNSDITFGTFPRLTDDFTISYWVNPDNYNEGGVYSIFLSQGRDNPCSGWQFLAPTTTNPNSLRLWYEVDSDNGCDPWTTFANAGLGNWQHVSWVYGNNGSHVYVNGELKRSHGYTAPINYKNSETLTVAEMSYSSNLFNSTILIDELRISSTQRSTDWITAEYASMNNLFTEFASVEAAYAEVGTLTSSVFDSTAASDWGQINWISTGSGTVSAKVRTGNNNMNDAANFGNCEPVTNGQDISTNSCVTDGHQYVQYQLTLTSGSTPVVESVSIEYIPQPPSIPPAQSTPTPTPIVEDTTAPPFELHKIGTLDYSTNYSTYYYTNPNLSFRGIGEVGADVNLTVNGQNTFQTQIIKADETWEMMNYQFTTGIHNVTLAATDSAGNITAIAFTLVIDPSADLFPDEIQSLLNGTGVTPTPIPTLVDNLTSPTPSPTDPSHQINEGETPGIQGNTLRLRITDPQNNPLVGVLVTLYSDPQTAITDRKGIVEFTNVVPGTHHVSFTYSGNEVNQQLNLLNDEQEYNLNITVEVESKTNPWIFVGGIVILISALIVFLFYFRKIRKPSF